MAFFSVALSAQIKKELLCIVRDPKARFVLVVPPLIQLFIFAFAITMDVNNVHISVVNHDAGYDGTRFVQDLDHARFVKELITPSSQAQVSELLNKRKVILSLTIPENFSAKISSGQAPEVQIIVDGRRANSGQITASYINSMLNEFYLEQRHIELHSAVQLRNWFNPNLQYTWFTVPALSGILAMLITLILTGLSISREREMGTFEQLLVSPSTAGQIIMAKLIAPMAIGFTLGCLMAAVGVFVFQLPFEGSLVLLLISLVVFIAAIAGIGLMISAVSDTQQQAILGAFAIMVPQMLLSGFSTPVANMPEILQWLAQLVPFKHYLIIVQGSFLKAVPFEVIWQSLWPMIAIAVGTVTASVWVVRSKLN